MHCFGDATVLDPQRYNVYVQALAHETQVVAAMTQHWDVVAWTIKNTDARPWVVAATSLCSLCAASKPARLKQMHLCGEPRHANRRDAWQLSPLHAACCAGDVDMVRRLMHDYAPCGAGVRRGTLRDEVGAQSVRRRRLF